MMTSVGAADLAALRALPAGHVPMACTVIMQGMCVVVVVVVVVGEGGMHAVHPVSPLIPPAD